MEPSEKILEPKESFSSRFENDFKIIKRLGKGGFGDVFEVHQKIDECNYALKRIIISKEESTERVLREVKSLAKLEHPNIVRYFSSWLEQPPSYWRHGEKWIDDQSSYDDSSSEDSGILEFDEEVINVFEKSLAKKGKVTRGNNNLKKSDSNPLKRKSNYEITHSKKKDSSSNISLNNALKSNQHNPVYLYIQMQLCKEHTLKDWLALHKVRVYNQVIGYFLQTLNAVEYIHNSGLMHRDLKPGNIFFSQDDQIKVGDFGLVKNFIPDFNLESENGTSIYSGHTLDVGTKLYMSPEQLHGRIYDEKIDIYSLGLIFFELLVPFSTEMERIKKISLIKEHIYPKDFSREFPYQYLIIRNMLCEDPSKRLAIKDIKIPYDLQKTI